MVRFKYGHWLPKKLDVTAITLYPYVLFADREDDVEEWLWNHEIAHVNQIIKWGRWRFYVSYLLYYFAARVAGHNHYDSYYLIPWEIDARAAESEGELSND